MWSAVLMQKDKTRTQDPENYDLGKEISLMYSKLLLNLRQVLIFYHYLPVGHQLETRCWSSCLFDFFLLLQMLSREEFILKKVSPEFCLYHREHLYLCQLQANASRLLLCLIVGSSSLSLAELLIYIFFVVIFFPQLVMNHCMLLCSAFQCVRACLFINQNNNKQKCMAFSQSLFQSSLFQATQHLCHKLSL